MDLKYLEEVVIPQREKEIEEGKNACTAQPIYVVLDLEMQVVDDHIEMPSSTNLRQKECEIGYVDDVLDGECIEFKKTKKGMEAPRALTQFYTDKFVAFFLTRKGADEYLRYQSHNMKEPYIYTFYSGYGNREMDAILKNK